MSYRGMRFADIHDPYLSPPERFPPDPPEWWNEEIRRMTDIDGVTIVLYRTQDGEEYVMDADEYDGDGPLP